MEYKYKCEYCSIEMEEKEHTTNEYECLCESCYEDLYTVCDYCGNEVLSDEIIWLENSGEFICEQCADNNDNIIWCDYHEKYEYAEITYHISGYPQMTICDDAMESGDFGFCEDCEEYYHIEDTVYCEEDEYNYCINCIDNHRSEFIHEYHSHDYNEKLSTKNDKIQNEKLFFGMELEIESAFNDSSNSDTVASAILDVTNDEFVFEQDGSLDNGFEIISRPFTRDYMLNELSDNIYAMLNEINKNGYRGLDTCGLHFHVSREAVKNERNLIRIVEFFKNELTILSRRNEKSLNRWSPFYSNNYELSEELLDSIVEHNHSRYHAINLDNEHTIEFRIFKSTTDFNELMATWELVNNIVAYANDHDTKLNAMPSFEEVATYQENNYIGKYMEGRLATTC